MDRAYDSDLSAAELGYGPKAAAAPKWDSADSGPDLCRGCPADIALAKCGRVLRNTGGHAMDMHDYSRPVKMIDQFWTHSRHAPQFGTVLALLWHYRRIHATAVAILVSAATVGIVSALWPGGLGARHFHEEFGESDSPYWQLASKLLEASLRPYADKATCVAILVAIGCGIVAFTCTLLSTAFWWRPPTVFLDRLCTSQASEHPKIQGIDHLPAFIRRSRQMLVVWDETFASSLRSIFELAVFAHDKKPKLNDHVRVRPRFMANMGAIMVMVNAFLQAALPLCLACGFELTKVAAVIGLVLSPMVFVGIHAWRHYLSDFHAAKEQIRKFSFHEAECFCCNVGHVHPVDNTAVMCDRKVILNIVGPLFGSIDVFNDVVRSFHDVWLATPQVSYIDSLVISSPSLWKAIATISSQWRQFGFTCALSQASLDLHRTLLRTPIMLLTMIHWVDAFAHCPVKGPVGNMVTFALGIGMWVILLFDVGCEAASLRYDDHGTFSHHVKIWFVYGAVAVLLYLYPAFVAAGQARRRDSLLS